MDMGRIRWALAGAIGAATIGAGATGATAQEVLLQNDTFEGGAGINLCPCFVAGEEAAVWLTSPCDGNIVGIQIYWQSFFGGDDPKIEDSIRIYEAGTFPNAGPLIDELLAPVLTDGFLNEFRTVDSVPISIPISAGETFVVSLRFFNPNENDFFAGTIGSDDDGCTNNANTVRFTNGTWNNACALGVSGDWVIRAIVECDGADPQGACCLPDGGCAEGLTLGECTALDGFWNGSGTLCSEVPCTGACFIPATGNCAPDFDKPTCDLVGGDWQGPGTTECNDSCPADCDESGVLNLDDIDCFVSGFLAVDTAIADCDGNGVLNLDDIDCFVAAFLAGCP